MTIDVKLKSDGDLQTVNTRVTGDDLIRQRVQIRILTFLGEWDLDARQGLPWFRWYEDKIPPVGEIQAVIQNELQGIEGIDFAPVEVTIDANFNVVITSSIRLVDPSSDIAITITASENGLALDFPAPSYL